ncbi:hypothetical protein U0C82_01405 [Fulvimarina sp. 2208YS6-2-32]|uniref:Uncharacterized protein n=1 Tax=Fulvimarina uroteuthidis TaxID=3098149 RepID=A0ABU5HXE4_9HYPH|nr:hypothetical protein [Fulvimarina sp. 2208YS6-2-32]MDY8107803.1 hypothetical protein [Fulvimarina sp. 2208YS6-2-32]
MADNDKTPLPKGGDKPAGTIDPDILSEDQLASERMGDNALQAKDQEARHNERKTQAGYTREPDDETLDAFRKMDDEK